MAWPTWPAVLIEPEKTGEDEDEALPLTLRTSVAVPDPAPFDAPIEMD
jgi:hypothetical protein